MQESRAEALLSLGHQAAAVRLLAPVAPVHPYREQLWALLARAQYACARQADALSTLATLRSRLAEDLGVDPSPLVRAMEQSILAQDPGLTGPTSRQDTPSRARIRCRSHRVSPTTRATTRTAPSTQRPLSEAIHAWRTARPIVT